MSDRFTVPGLSEDEQSWLNSLWSQLREHRPRNLLRSAFYDGKHAARDLGFMAPQYRSLGLVLGWNAKGVDSLARRSHFEDMYWPDGTLTDLGYREFADANQLAAEIRAGQVNSLVHGVSFLINTTGDPDQGEPSSLLHVKDALNATGVWNPRKRSLDAALSIHAWEERESGRGDRPRSFTLYLDGLTVTCERVPGSGWSIDRQGHRWGVPVEPLKYKPGPRPFGQSRITRVTMSLQDAGVRVLRRMEGHNDIFSLPQMAILGASEDIFKNADGSQMTKWQIALGRALGIPDDDDQANPRADVKQFPASSPEPHLAALNAFAKLAAREFSLPDVALAITDLSNPVSAEAYVASNDDLIAEAEGATDDWALPIRRAVARGLAIQNGEADIPELSTLGVQWRPAVHLSRAAAADAGMKQLAVAPWLAETEVGLELLGLDKSQRERALAERARAQGRSTLESILAGVSTTDALGD